jgi:hypothetical protein
MDWLRRPTLGVDTETTLIEQRRPIPLLVSLAVSDCTPAGTQLYHHTEALQPAAQLLTRAARGEVNVRPRGALGA